MRYFRVFIKDSFRKVPSGILPGVSSEILKRLHMRFLQEFSGLHMGHQGIFSGFLKEFRKSFRNSIRESPKSFFWNVFILGIPRIPPGALFWIASGILESQKNIFQYSSKNFLGVLPEAPFGFISGTTSGTALKMTSGIRTVTPPGTSSGVPPKSSFGIPPGISSRILLRTHLRDFFGKFVWNFF